MKLSRLLAVLLWLPVSALAQTPVSVAVIKADGYRQVSATEVVPGTFVFAVEVAFNGSPLPSTTVQLRTPSGASIPLTREPDGTYAIEREFPSRAALDAAFPQGAYTVVVNSTASVTVPVAAGGPFTPVLISNFDALQASPEPNVLIEWPAIPGVGSDDFLSLEIERADGTSVFSTASSLSPFTTSQFAPGLPVGVPLTGGLAYVSLAFSQSGSTVIVMGRGFFLEFPLQVVLTAPIIRTPPASAVMELGGPASFSVNAAGIGLSYQWLRNGQPIPGATSQFLNLPGVQVADAGRYSVRVSNATGAVTSEPAMLAVSGVLDVATFAGAGRIAGAVDGSLAVARFSSPQGIAYDAAGNLFVADTGNSAIRRVAPDGTVTTFAGVLNTPGFADGAGAAARFRRPAGLALDRAGNLYVSDAAEHVIRKITAAGMVSTLAGTAGQAGYADGAVSAARFNEPYGIAVDATGTVYVSEASNHVIRRITPAGVVSTVAGRAGQPGFTDGSGAAAQFMRPVSLSFDPAGRLVVADQGNDALRRVTSAGLVSTIGVAGPLRSPQAVAVDAQGVIYAASGNVLQRATPAGAIAQVAGSSAFSGLEDGRGLRAVFSTPMGLAFDSRGALVISDTNNHALRRAGYVPGGDNAFITVDTAPRAARIESGGTVVFSTEVSGAPAYVQWLRNGAAIPGATTTALVVRSAAEPAGASYSALVGNAAGVVATAPVGFSSTPAGTASRITNLSIRSVAGRDAQTLIVGFAVSASGGGAASLPILSRAIGPGLVPFGVEGTSPDPQLALFRGGASIASNDNWSTGDPSLADLFTALGAFPLSRGSADAALRANVAPGTYTLQVTNAGAGTGVALAELYDATAAGGGAVGRLTNVSARTQVGRGGDILIAGFAIAGATDKTVLIRAVGQDLAAFGVEGNLRNPKLELYAGQRRLAANDTWSSDAATVAVFTAVGAFRMTPLSNDAVILATLPPGLYSAQISGVGDTTGVALVEIYEVP